MYVLFSDASTGCNYLYGIFYVLNTKKKKKMLSIFKDKVHYYMCISQLVHALWLVSLAGHVLLQHCLLNLKVSFPACPINLRDIILISY